MKKTLEWGFLVVSLFLFAATRLLTAGQAALPTPGVIWPPTALAAVAVAFGPANELRSVRA